MTITIHDDIRNDDDNDSVANNDFQRMPSLTLEKEGQLFDPASYAEIIR